MNTSNYPITSLPWSCSDPLPKHQWLLETPLVIIEENELPQWGNADELVRVVKEMGGTPMRFIAFAFSLQKLLSSPILTQIVQKFQSAR